jgi:O-antigen/teichoic acid export membrane protein
MGSLVTKIKGNEFFRNNATLFIGSLLVAFLNYLYYPVLGRLLSVEQFGEVQVLLSFLTQLSVILTAFGLLTTNIVVNEEKQKANQIVTELSRAALYVSIGLLVVISLAAVPLQQALKFSSWVPFVLLGAAFIVGAILTFQGGYLRAKKDFLATSIQGIVGSLAKIILSGVLVLIGFQTAGALGGFVIAQVLTLLYTTYQVRKRGFEKQSTSKNKVDWGLIRPHLPYVLFAFATTMVMTLFYSFDAVLVKYLFSPEIAGQYAGISTMARVVLFLTGSFGVVLMSSVKLDAAVQQNARQLIKATLITIGMGGVAALIFALFPSFMTHLLFGTRYDALSYLLPYLSFSMLFVSVAMLLSNYHVALRQYWVLLYVGIGVVIVTVLLALNHATVEAVVVSIFYGSASLLVSLAAWTAYTILPALRNRRIDHGNADS